MTIEPSAQVERGIDLREVRTQCERIRSGFQALYDWIPVRPLTGAGFARWSGLKGPLCRRMLAAIHHRDDPLDLVRILPGLEGLSLVIEALEERGCPERRLQPARQAAAAFAELLHLGGGSQRKLIAAVAEENGIVHDERPPRDRRRHLFEAAREVYRAACDTMVAIDVVYPSREDSGRVDGVTALGRLGYRARSGAPPFITKRYAYPDEARSGAAPLPGTLLQERFGTPDLRLTDTRLGDGRILTTCEGRRPEEPIDLWNGPVHDEGLIRFVPGEPAGHGNLAALGTPTRTLVHEMWVARPLAHASVLRTGVYRATPETFSAMDFEQWYDRLPGEPAVHMPGADLGAGVESISAWHPDVLRTCFEHADQDPEDFVGYRCIVEFPVWMAVYRMQLEFAPDHGFG